MFEQLRDIFQEFALLLPLSGKETSGAGEGGGVVLGSSLIHKLLTQPPPLPPQFFSGWTWFRLGLTTGLASCKAALRPAHTYNTLQGQTPSLTQ